MMRLDLKDILQKDGAASFAYAPDFSTLAFSSISRFLGPVQASGCVTSSAGVLTLSGEVRVQALCLCDRCGAEFQRELSFPLDTPLAESLLDTENPDIFPIEEDAVDLDEVVTTAFVLGLDSKMLCRPNCKGLCPRCGQNWNDGACGCGSEPDSRLAVLGQLLELE